MGRRGGERCTALTSVVLRNMMLVSVLSSGESVGEDYIGDGCGDQRQLFDKPRPPHQSRGSQAHGAMQGNRLDKEIAPESTSSSSSFLSCSSSSS